MRTLQCAWACTYAGANKIMSYFLAPGRKDRRERDYASSGPTLPSADRATPVERPSHSRQLLVPREWHALRIRIRIPYACTTIPLTDARRLPLCRTSTPTLLGILADIRIRPCIHNPFAFLLKHFTQQGKYYWFAWHANNSLHPPHKPTFPSTTQHLLPN